MKIIKRSGSEAVYDSNKIIAAVQKANASVIDYEKLSDEQIKEIADNVETACENMKRSPSVEEIQDMVEEYMQFTKKNGYFDYKRNEQAKYWMYESINDTLRDKFNCAGC